MLGDGFLFGDLFFGVFGGVWVFVSIAVRLSEAVVRVGLAVARAKTW